MLLGVCILGDIQIIAVEKNLTYNIWHFVYYVSPRSQLLRAFRWIGWSCPEKIEKIVEKKRKSTRNSKKSSYKWKVTVSKTTQFAEWSHTKIQNETRRNGWKQCAFFAWIVSKTQLKYDIMRFNTSKWITWKRWWREKKKKNIVKSGECIEKWWRTENYVKSFTISSFVVGGVDDNARNKTKKQIKARASKTRGKYATLVFFFVAVLKISEKYVLYCVWENQQAHCLYLIYASLELKTRWNAIFQSYPTEFVHAIENTLHH